MLWFYWRRARLGVLITGVVFASVAALVVLTGSAAQGSGQGNRRSALANRRSGARISRGAGLMPSPAQTAMGVALMDSAVVACGKVSYTGLQIVAWWGNAESTTYLIQVWHASGEPEVADGDGGIAGGPGSIAVPSTAAADHAFAGVLSVSPWMLSLLRSNYVIEYAGTGSADSRSARIVAVRRHDGSLAARYWLDQLTGLPLRREMFDSSGHLVSEGAFIDVRFGDVDGQPVPPKIAQAWTTRPTKKNLPRLRQQGWPVPSRLGRSMTLVGVSSASPASGTVLDASYSDGLSVVSVFMQRGQLAGALPGWTHTDVNGIPLYSSQPDERSLAWSANGIVYTVISDAPESTVDQVIAQLPHDRNGGLWQRVGRGLKRMGSWFDPFS